MSPEERKRRFTEFFKRDYKRLLKFVHRLIDDAADRNADDIIQDVMLNLFDKSDLTVPIENLSAYIYKSLKNRIVDLFRKRELDVINSESIDMENLSLEYIFNKIDNNPSTELEKQELYDILYRSIESLDENERHLIIATEFDHIPFRSLSEAWGIPIGTLLSRKTRAIKKIKSNFKQLTIET
jgi:RNA polymerase sigma factor (sigma-70 family)